MPMTLKRLSPVCTKTLNKTHIFFHLFPSILSIGCILPTISMHERDILLLQKHKAIIFILPHVQKYNLEG
jgi:hypothetical protein